MERKQYRQVVFYRHYYEEFYSTLESKVKLKITWTIDLIESIERVPSKYLEHLTGTEGLYEIRVSHGSNIYRIFCFFDEGRLVIAISGFQKKTQRTPRNQIRRAERIRKEYFDEKDKR